MNLATKYLGLSLRNPLIVGASPFCDDPHVARQLQDAGAAAVVMRSLFEEQWDSSLEPRRPPGPVDDDDDSAVDIDYPFSPEQYLRHLRRLKQTLTIPVIASLNGYRPSGWNEFARRLESEGADAIELNFYQVVTDPTMASDEVELAMIRTVNEVVNSVGIPVAVKLSPFHSSVAQLATALELAGADGIVLFNRFFQPDVDTDEIRVTSQLRLSDPGELLLRLRWLAVLSPQISASLSATGGVHSSHDVVKALLTGADTVQVVSVLLKQGPNILSILLLGLQAWMSKHGFQDIGAFRGMLDLRRCNDPAGFERANYVRTLQSWRV